MTKSLIEADGSLVSVFSDDTPIPDTLVTQGRSVISSPPGDATQKWTRKDWGAAPNSGA